MPEQANGDGPTTSPAAVHLRMVELVTAGRWTEALALVHPDVIDHRGGTTGDHIGLAAWKERYDQMDERVRDFSVTLLAAMQHQLSASADA